MGFKSRPLNNVIRKREKKLTRKQVLTMLAVMEASQGAVTPNNSASDAPPTPSESTANVQEFLSSGRTGRRNALPDILALNPENLLTYSIPEFTDQNVAGQHAVVTSSDLSTKLQGLTTSDKPSDDPHNQPGSSKS